MVQMSVRVFLAFLFSLFLCGQIWSAQDTLRPIDDYECQWVPGVDCYAEIDESGEHDGDETFISETGDGEHALFELETFSGSGTVDSVRWEGWFKAFVSGGTIRLGRRWYSEGSWVPCSPADTHSVTETGSYVLFKQTWSSSPCVEDVWTADIINHTSLSWEIYSVDIVLKSTIRCTQAYAIVYSTEEAGGNPRGIRWKKLIGENNEEGYRNFMCSRPDRSW